VDKHAVRSRRAGVVDLIIFDGVFDRRVRSPACGRGHRPARRRPQERGFLRSGGTDRRGLGDGARDRPATGPPGTQVRESPRLTRQRARVSPAVVSAPRARTRRKHHWSIDAPRDGAGDAPDGIASWWIVTPCFVSVPKYGAFPGRRRAWRWLHAPPWPGSAARRAVPCPDCGVRPVCPAGSAGARWGAWAPGPIYRGRGPTGPGVAGGGGARHSRQPGMKRAVATRRRLRLFRDAHFPQVLIRANRGCDSGGRWCPRAGPPGRGQGRQAAGRAARPRAGPQHYAPATAMEPRCCCQEVQAGTRVAVSWRRSRCRPGR